MLRVVVPVRFVSEVCALVFDAVTIAAVADELGREIVDGRIQRTGLSSARALVLEIYAGGRRRHLVADAENGSDAVYLAEREPPIDSQIVTPFSLLMRKYLRGGTVMAVEQPPLERVVRLSIAKRLEPAHRGEALDAPEVADEEIDDDPEGIEGATFVHLVVEVMGRHSNLILVDDDGRVMESVKRVTPSMSRVRPVLPKLPYTPPPAQQKSDPRRVTAESLRSWLEDGSPRQSLAKALPADFRAMSPQLAREVAYLAAGRLDATRADALAGDLAELARRVRRLYEPVLTGEWQPVVYRSEDEQVVAFSPYPLDHLRVSAIEVQAGSISTAAEASVGRQDEESPGRHAGRIARLLSEIATVRGRLVAKIESLDVQTDRMVDADTRRLWGELIYGYLWKIQPGDAELDADGVIVPLDPERSPKDVAHDYIYEYRDAQTGGRQISEVRETTERDITYLDQLATLVRQAEAFVDVEALEREWAASSLSSTKANAPRKPRSAPAKRIQALERVAGYDIYLGRSGGENDTITFDVASASDLWLHARGVPGSHVIVRTHGDPDVPDETLTRGAELAAYFSSARTSGRVEVDITERRHVRKIKGAGPGMVTYRNERTVSVEPRGLEEVGGRRKG